MAHPEVAAEQAHVDRAYRGLEAMRDGAVSMLRDAFGERGGTFQSLAERDIRVRTSLNRLEHLQIGGEALVFGRLDRDGRAGADRTGERFHVGRLGVSDADQEPLVVDWRAPVAEPFYRATGAQPMGLRRRRHLLTHGRTVVDLEDELFDPEDAPDGSGGANLGLAGRQVLIAALDRSRTGRMTDIVATVQREQDEVIRDPLGGVLVVQGGPGTGKTAVALHRAAYLLYTHRFPLERQGLLVVGPSALFLRYVEHVLPSLGETGVQMSTVAGLFGEAVPAGSEPPELARLKGDDRMARLLARAAGDRQRPLRKTVVVPFGRRFLRITPSMSRAVVAAAKRRGGTHNSRRRVLESLLWRALALQLEERTNGTAAATEPAPVAGWAEEAAESPADLGQRLRRVPEVVAALDRMWPLLPATELVHDLFGAPALLRLAGEGLLAEAELAMLCRPRSSSALSVAWTAADMALLDEARALLGAPRRRSGPPDGEDGDDGRWPAHPSYGHIVVDEAQDLSPMELRMLARRSLAGSMTVVGDLAQGTGGWAASSWAEVTRHLPARRAWRQAELTVNYRTPWEVMAVAGRVLEAAAPGTVPPEAIRTTGDLPRILRTDASGPAGPASLPALVARTVGEEVAVLTDHSPDPERPGGTVGVVVPPSLAEPVAGALTAARLPAGRPGAGALDAVVSVLGVDEAKGLEFDSVVVVEPGLLVAEAAGGLRALYVALTRTTRRLAVVHAQPLPEPLVAGLATAATSPVR
ncbi:MAG: HelD family protein [Acidimicrobiales bacterium]